MHTIQQHRRVPECGGCGEGVTGTGALVPSVIIGTHLIPGVRGRELIEHLTE